MHGQCTPCLNFLPLHSGTIEVKAGTARIAVPKNRPAMRWDGRFQKARRRKQHGKQKIQNAVQKPVHLDVGHDGSDAGLAWLSGG